MAHFLVCGGEKGGGWTSRGEWSRRGIVPAKRCLSRSLFPCVDSSSFSTFEEKTGKRQELQSDVQTRGLSHCEWHWSFAYKCVQINRQLSNMAKYVVMTNRGPHVWKLYEPYLSLSNKTVRCRQIKQFPCQLATVSKSCNACPAFGILWLVSCFGTDIDEWRCV